MRARSGRVNGRATQTVDLAACASKDDSCLGTQSVPEIFPARLQAELPAVGRVDTSAPSEDAATAGGAAAEAAFWDRLVAIGQQQPDNAEVANRVRILSSDRKDIAGLDPAAASLVAAFQQSVGIAGAQPPIMGLLPRL